MDKIIADLFSTTLEDWLIAIAMAVAPIGGGALLAWGGYRLAVKITNCGVGK